MTRKTLNLMGCLVAMFASGVAFAEEGGQEELVEKVAVRNRLFSVEGRFEVGANVGFTLLSKLTEHYNFNASVAWNIKDWFALEVRGGYAASRLTSLAEQIQGDFFANTTISKASDGADAWRMNAHGVLGLRFQPIYGKINLVAELPIHFQLYFWLGGGVSGFQRESIVHVPRPKRRAAITCATPTATAALIVSARRPSSPTTAWALWSRWRSASASSLASTTRFVSKRVTGATSTRSS